MKSAPKPEYRKAAPQPRLPYAEWAKRRREKQIARIFAAGLPPHWTEERAAKYLAGLLAVKAEREAEKRGIWNVPYPAYAEDPEGFVKIVLGEFFWSKQREIARALHEHDRVAVKSCHSSGKSFCVGSLVGWHVVTNRPDDVLVVTSAPTEVQVVSILWREIGRMHTRANLPGTLNLKQWWFGRLMVAFGRKPGDTDPTAFQGHHAKKLLVVFDEACGIPAALWDAAETLLANGGKFLAIGNPDDPSTEFAAVCKPGSGWHVITISAFNTPNFTGELVPDFLRELLISAEWVEQRRRRWGEDSPLWKSKVLGEFPDQAADALISPAWIAAAVVRSLEIGPDDPNDLGVDVARQGRNETVIYHRHGPQARLWKAYRNRDLMHTVGQVILAVEETGARRIKIDDIGMGGGVTDRLLEVQREHRATPGGGVLSLVDIIAVNVGITLPEQVEPVDDEEEDLPKAGRERCFNVKSRLSWDLRVLFQDGLIDLDDDPDTQGQLAAIVYEVNSRGRIVIESKEQMEERLNKLGGASAESRSPDRADALILAFAEVESLDGWELMRRAAIKRRDAAIAAEHQLAATRASLQARAANGADAQVAQALADRVSRETDAAKRAALARYTTRQLRLR